MSVLYPRRLPVVLLSAFCATGLAAQSTATDLSDAEVAHVAVTANTIDIELARFAQARATDPAVKQFAATMITDHSAVNGQASALAGKLGITPRDNAVSQSLLTSASQARSALEPLHGRAFDRAYLEREVGYHQAVLEALDGVLIPTTSNAELGQLLREARQAVAAHLEHARHLLASRGRGW